MTNENKFISYFSCLINFHFRFVINKDSMPSPNELFKLCLRFPTTIRRAEKLSFSLLYFLDTCCFCYPYPYTNMQGMLTLRNIEDKTK